MSGEAVTCPLPGEAVPYLRGGERCDADEFTQPRDALRIQRQVGRRMRSGKSDHCIPDVRDNLLALVTLAVTDYQEAEHRNNEQGTQRRENVVEAAANQLLGDGLR